MGQNDATVAYVERLSKVVEEVWDKVDGMLEKAFLFLEDVADELKKEDTGPVEEKPVDDFTLWYNYVRTHGTTTDKFMVESWKDWFYENQDSLKGLYDRIKANQKRVNPNVDWEGYFPG